jgi:hypothetical protein
MFRSPYSPFFTSGLLSASPPSSPSPEPHSHPRRGSLPTDNSPSFLRSSVSEDSSAFYCTLQPKRDKQEFRSFLSLDLAESQSMRSFGKHRGTGRFSKSSALPEVSIFQKYSCVSSFRLVTQLLLIGYRTVLEVPLSTTNRISLRSSRDSIRSIPSPKPVPSVSLPSVPSLPSIITTDLPPQLPPIVRTPPLRISTLERASLSLPSLIHREPPSPRPPSVRSSAAPSRSPTWFRTASRSDALARLEGRAKSRRPIQRNFMSMSDDDEDYEDEDEEEEEDRLRCSLSDQSQVSDFLRAARLAAILDGEATFSPRLESRMSLPLARQPSLKNWAKMSRLGKRKTVTTESWFPLASFMDDDSSWNWRSFVEIAGVA